MTIVFALLAAFANALNVTTQHKASIASPPKVRGWQLVVYLFKSPLWWFGWIAIGGSFVFQALALSHGALSVVQSLLITELIFALVLRRVWIGQPIRNRTWWSAVATCVLLAVFLVVAEPQGGVTEPSRHAWVWTCGTVIGIAVVLTLVGMRGSPRRRAALMASATAIMWALVATFIKATMTTLSQFGVAGVFVRWPVYALAVAGLAAEVLDQATLHVGPLSYSQPFLVVVDPIASIALSVWVFEEYFTESAGRLFVGATSFVCMCVAIFVLTTTTPPTMQPVADSACTSP